MSEPQWTVCMHVVDPDARPVIPWTYAQLFDLSTAFGVSHGGSGSQSRRH